MKSSIEVIEEHAQADGVTFEEYLRRKANLAILSDEDSAILSGGDYLVVEVTQEDHVRVVDAHESPPQAKLSIVGPGGELRKGRKETSDYLIISCASDAESSIPTPPAIPEPAPQVIPDQIQSYPAFEAKPRRDTFFRSGMIWTSNRRKP